MFPFSQVLAHILGDYWLQSDWMALNKYKKLWIAVLHGFIYTLCFLPFTRSPWALLAIWWSHALIDHYQLPKYLVWLHNFMAPKWIPHEVQVPNVIVGYRDADGQDKSKVLETYPKTVMVRNYPWKECYQTGFSLDRPVWLTVWLGIICDNSLHIVLNALAIHYL